MVLDMADDWRQWRTAGTSPEKCEVVHPATDHDGERRKMKRWARESHHVLLGGGEGWWEAGNREERLAAFELDAGGVRRSREAEERRKRTHGHLCT